MFMSSVQLRTDESGSTGALTSFLASAVRLNGNPHHLVWSLFENKPERDFVFRTTGASAREPILVYSPEPVRDSHNLWKVESKPFILAENLKAGDLIEWSLRLNATVKHGKQRRDLVIHDRFSGNRRPCQAVAAEVIPPWLSPKLAKIGLKCEPRKIHVGHWRRVQFQHDIKDKRQAITLGITEVSGVGEVTNADRLRAGLLKGVGSGRAYGCGMLLIRRARNPDKDR